MKNFSVSEHKNDTGITVKSVETDEELRLANAFIANVAGPNSLAVRNWLDAHGSAYPGYQRDHTRIALSNDEIISALRINSETLRIGDARLKVGGLGWISIANKDIGSSFLNQLISDTLGYMKRHAYHVTMLFNTPALKNKIQQPDNDFGFSTTLAEHAIFVDTVEASSLKTILDTRKGKPGDIDLIAKLHNLGENDQSCSLVRTRGHITNKWQSWRDSLHVILDQNAKVIAYFIANIQPKCLSVNEIGLADQSLCDDVLATCAHMAAENMLGRVRFQIAPDHLFARYLMNHNSKHEMEVNKDSGGMMALVDTGETLENMIPEWENLLNTSPAKELRTEFTLLVSDKVDKRHYAKSNAFRIRTNRGAVDITTVPGKNKVSLTGGELINLLTGYRHLNNILDTHRRLLTSESRMLMAALFPKRTPYVWLFDRF